MKENTLLHCTIKNIGAAIESGQYQFNYKNFRDDLFEAFNLIDHPKKDLLFLKAWNLGNTITGQFDYYLSDKDSDKALLCSVFDIFSDLSELLL